MTGTAVVVLLVEVAGMLDLSESRPDKTQFHLSVKTTGAGMPTGDPRGESMNREAYRHLLFDSLVTTERVFKL